MAARAFALKGGFSASKGQLSPKTHPTAASVSGFTAVIKGSYTLNIPIFDEKRKAISGNIFLMK
jgi:hypothetical protein